jgi:hypothetical protein
LLFEKYDDIERLAVKESLGAWVSVVANATLAAIAMRESVTLRIVGTKDLGRREFEMETELRGNWVEDTSILRLKLSRSAVAYVANSLPHITWTCPTVNTFYCTSVKAIKQSTK